MNLMRKEMEDISIKTKWNKTPLNLTLQKKKMKQREKRLRRKGKKKGQYLSEQQDNIYSNKCVIGIPNEKRRGRKGI